MYYPIEQPPQTTVTQRATPQDKVGQPTNRSLDEVTQNAKILPFNANSTWSSAPDKISADAPSIASNHTQLHIAQTKKKKTTGSYSRVLRTHYIKRVLEDLLNLKEYCGTHDAAIYANSLFHATLTYRDKLPYEPFLDILFVVYDAMAYKNNWINFTERQYQEAHNVLRDYADQQLDSTKIKRAFIKLEAAGFDLMPYEVDVNLSEPERTYA